MAKKKQQIEMVSVAKFDANKVYQGIEFIDRKTLTADHVQVPGDCDLKTGKYYWSVEKQAFMPTTAFLVELKLAKRKMRGSK
jgi:hypothetical protein